MPSSIRSAESLTPAPNLTAFLKRSRRGAGGATRAQDRHGATNESGRRPMGAVAPTRSVTHRARQLQREETIAERRGCGALLRGIARRLGADAGDATLSLGRRAGSRGSGRGSGGAVERVRAGSGPDGEPALPVLAQRAGVHFSDGARQPRRRRGRGGQRPSGRRTRTPRGAWSREAGKSGAGARDGARRLGAVRGCPSASSRCIPPARRTSGRRSPDRSRLPRAARRGVHLPRHVHLAARALSPARAQTSLWRGAAVRALRRAEARGCCPAPGPRRRRAPVPRGRWRGAWRPRGARRRGSPSACRSRTPSGGPRRTTRSRRPPTSGRSCCGRGSTCRSA